MKFSCRIVQMFVVVKELQILDFWQRYFKDEGPSVALKQLQNLYIPPQVFSPHNIEKKLSDLQ